MKKSVRTASRYNLKKSVRDCQSVQGYNGSLPLTFISNDDASVRAFIKTSRGQEFNTREVLFKKTTFLLCCNHEPVRLTPNINKPRCHYHRFTARVAINKKNFSWIWYFFYRLFAKCWTITDITYLRHLPTSPTDISYIRHNLHTPSLTYDIACRHYLHTPLLTYDIAYRHYLPTLPTDITYRHPLILPTLPTDILLSYRHTY